MTFFDFFDRVWIISLAERTDRRRRIGHELSRIGLPLTPGRVEFFDAIRPGAADGFPSAGYHGCFLSHRAVMGLGLEARAARILVFEDDVVFHPDFRRHEQDAVAALGARPDWGVVQFGHITTDPVVGRGLQTPPRGVLGLHFYAVNGPTLPGLRQWFDASLERPAGHPDGSRMSPDGTMNHFRWAHPQVPAFLYVPILGRQSNSPSDLGGRKWFDRVPVLGPLVRYGRDFVRREAWD